MKKKGIILSAMLSLALIFTSCNKEDTEPLDTNILPENFTVEIPQALMSEGTKSLKNTNDEVLNGNDIYFHLSNFICVGNEAAEIVSDIIKNIRLYNLSQPMSFTYQSEEDGQAKNVVITSNSEFEEHFWEYQMNITDADSEGNEDGGIAVQIFWNRNPVKGIAIIKPSNFDNNSDENFANATFRIDYSETGDNYEQEMTVYIAGLTLDNPLENPYSMETLKMTVGKNGNTIEVYGNSNHPNAVLFNSESGYNWAFVAAGSNVSDICVAEVALPPSELNSTSRSVLFGEYALQNVFSLQIYEMWPFILPELVETYLQNTEAPGYFNNNGFVSAGTAPGPEYEVFSTEIKTLCPFNPIEVSHLRIAFKVD